MLGTSGLRALTHPRVDEQAGLPKGSTSNYFRTRAALLCGGRAAMADLVVPALARLGARDPDAAADALAACFDGLFISRIARHLDIDPRPVFEVVIRGALVQTV